MRSHGARAAVIIVLVLTLAACGDGRRAELQIVVRARKTAIFGGRFQGITLSASAVRWTVDLVEIGGRPCRLTGLVIAIHNPDQADLTRSYTAAALMVPPEIPPYGTLHLDRNEWFSSENWVTPPYVPLASTLVLDVAARFRDGRDERVATATFGPGMPMD